MINDHAFSETKITQIVAYDSELFFEISALENFKQEFGKRIKKIEYIKVNSPEFYEFGEKSYDPEYAEYSSNKIIIIEGSIKTPKIFTKYREYLEDLEKERPEDKLTKNEFKKRENIKEDFNSAKKVIEKYCSKTVEMVLSFDSCGVQSAKFDFNTKILEPLEFINLVSKISYMIDTCFFPLFKRDLEVERIICEKKFTLLNHMTFSVITSTESYFIPYKKRREILGIALVNNDYETFSNKILKKMTENDIAIHNSDILLVSPISVLMVFPGLKKKYYYDYVEERMNIIEIVWRQKILLKKMHFQLGYYIDHIEQIKESEGLNSAINEILEIQSSFQSELEVYRNNIVHTTYSYAMLLETLNKVLKLDNHYLFVQEKLETCKSIYERLSNERRNNLMENIQWIVILLGVTAILLPILTNVIYEPLIPEIQKIMIIFIIVSLLFIGFLIIYNNYVRNKVTKFLT